MNIPLIFAAVSYFIIATLGACWTCHIVACAFYPKLKLMSKRRQVLITSLIFAVAWQLALLFMRH